jgi:hypothetical protein
LSERGEKLLDTGQHMKFLGILFFLWVSLGLYGTELYHRVIKPSEHAETVLTWTQKNTIPFHEVIISWSGQRPARGAFVIEVSVCKKNEWSPWFSYMYWGASQQHAYKLEAYRKIQKFLGTTKGTGFRIRIKCQDGALLKTLRAVHACVTNLAQHKVLPELPTLIAQELCVAPISQIALNHVSSTRICAPTSTSVGVAFLMPGTVPNPLAFAERVCAGCSRIYGVWALNTAQAAHELGSPWYCYVARFSRVQQLINQLNQGYPIVVSIQGPIVGGARPYEAGHLLVVRGYDAVNKKVLCMDPAFSDNLATYVAYDSADFIAAWNRRKGMAYVFTQSI